MTPLTYTPVYIGLYLSLVLALACNAYLDIQYGSFSTEVMVWAVIFGATLLVGWQQQGKPSDKGRSLQKILLVVSVLAFLLIFMRMWGLPRAGVYWLAAMQAANNCTTTTRRHLYYGATVSVVMVLFASSHFRADWSMLFYVIPFVITIVFTLVADQISQRADEIRSLSVGQQKLGGQWVAIGSASTVILALSALLYALMPQTDWGHLNWDYGLPAAKSIENSSGKRATGASGKNTSDAGSAGESLPESGLTGSRSDWPSSEQMRKVANRPGMPEWQAKLINGMADVSESVSASLETVEKHAKSLMALIKRYISIDMLRLLLGLLILALLIAALFLMREIRPVAWLWTQLDYFRYAILGRNRNGHQEIIKVYGATEKLFAYYGEPRTASENTQEYLQRLLMFRSDLRAEVSQVTEIFERTRYGANKPHDQDVIYARGAYRKIFRQLAN